MLDSIARYARRTAGRKCTPPNTNGRMCLKRECLKMRIPRRRANTAWAQGPGCCAFELRQSRSPFKA
jgi:hypothetical protein